MQSFLSGTYRSIITGDQGSSRTSPGVSGPRLKGGGGNPTKRALKTHNCRLSTTSLPPRRNGSLFLRPESAQPQRDADPGSDTAGRRYGYVPLDPPHWKFGSMLCSPSEISYASLLSAAVL